MNRFVVVMLLASALVVAFGLASPLASAQQGEQRGQTVQSDAAVRLAHGKAVFEKWCAPCHGEGPGKPGTAALQALYQGRKPALLEQRTDLAPEMTKTFVRNGVSIMPFFRKTEISDSDLDALATYLAK
jgi:mono/diheme cytochrome c family protein